MICSTIVHENFPPVVQLVKRKKTGQKSGVTALFHFDGDARKEHYYCRPASKYSNPTIARAGRLTGISADSGIKPPHSWGNSNTACDGMFKTSVNIESADFSR